MASANVGVVPLLLRKPESVEGERSGVVEDGGGQSQPQSVQAFPFELHVRGLAALITAKVVLLFPFANQNGLCWGVTLNNIF